MVGGLVKPTPVDILEPIVAELTPVEGISLSPVADVEADGAHLRSAPGSGIENGAAQAGTDGRLRLAPAQ